MNKLKLLIIMLVFLLPLTLAIPLIEFTTPTFPNATSTTNTSIEINVSITESNLSEVIYNWNNTNFTYYNDSLILMYNFDNISALGESEGIVRDLSFQNKSFTVYGTTPTFNSGGKYGGAYQFNGNGFFYIDSYIPEIRTLSFWMNTYDQYSDLTPPYDNPKNRYIFSQRFDAGEETGNWDMDWFAQPNLRIYAYDSGGGQAITTNTEFDTNTWYHITVTSNGTDVVYYVNGMYDSTSAFDVVFGGASNNDFLYIGGGGANDAYYYFNGSLDEVRIWNRSLSATEVYQQYISNINKFNQTDWHLYVNQSKNATEGLDEGDYNYQIFAEDGAGNLNQTDLRSITITSEDTIYPGFSNYKDNNSTLVGSGTAWFNVTVIDTNTTVYLEINDTNHTATNLSADVYNVSVAGLGNGTYPYKWMGWGNGTSNNYNVSETRSYTINSSTPVSGVTLDLGWIYPTSNIDVEHKEFFNITTNITCLGGNCGAINVTLDPYPAQCESYTDLDWDNNYLGAGNSITECSSGLSAGWYRLNETYQEIAEQQAYNNYDCGTHAPGYLNFSHPTTAGETTTGKICYHWSSNTCNWQTTNVSATACNGYYVYYLGPAPACSLHPCSTNNITDAPGGIKSGVVSMNANTTPFYTNTTNPYNLTLNVNQSSLITWWVNATGELNTNHTFFIFANLTSNETISNITSKLNITIKDTTPPIIGIAYPTNTTYVTSITELNYTYQDTNGGGSCWYTTDNGETNESLSVAGTNFTGLSSSGGSNTWTVYCNDSSANENSTSVTFASNIPLLNLDLIFPTQNINASQDNFFNVTVNISCSVNDCGEINVSLDPASQPVSCKEILDTDQSTGNGTYTIYPFGNDTGLTVYCDMDTDDGGWTLVFGGKGSTTTYGSTWAGWYSMGNIVNLSDKEIEGKSQAYDHVNFTTIMLETNHTGAGIILANVDREYDALINLTGPNPGSNNGNTSWDTGLRGNFSSYNRTGTYFASDYIAVWVGDGGADANDRVVFATAPLPTADWAGNNNVGAVGGESRTAASTTNWFYVYVRENTTYVGTKSGLISTNSSATPFSTNVTNPYNLSLNQDESSLITWWVNTTGDLNTTHTFFVYANITSDFSNSAVTDTWNVTIQDNTLPVINIAYPINTTYDTSITELNYSHKDTNKDSCWYTTDNGETNSTPVTDESNFTSVTCSGGSNTWTVYCNDSSGNENSASVSFVSSIPLISLELITPTRNINTTQNKTFRVQVNISCSNNNCSEINVTLDPSGNVYNFTTCSASGKTGPNQSQCDTNYSGTNLEGLVTVAGGIQNWTVPTTGTYTIEAVGAVGGLHGGSLGGNIGGNGSRMIGDFVLTAGEVLQIVVGQKGGSGSTSGIDLNQDNAGGGGGGGTFVYYNHFGNGGTYPLIAAGGGGGAETSNDGVNAVTIENGTASIAGSTAGLGGTNGSNGSIGGASWSYHGGAGAGWKSRHTFRSTTDHGESGYSYPTWVGGDPGPDNPDAEGGFGGGGGASEDNGGAGGGGGYSGGGASSHSGGGAGGGGGSYNNGTNQNNTAGINTGDGYVTFTFSGSTKSGIISTNSSATPFSTNVTNPYNLSLNQDESSLITWWVNSTGNLNTTHTFFVFANKTSDQSISDITAKWNVTIVNFTVDNDDPTIILNYPASDAGTESNLTFSYTPTDNNNLTNCSLILNKQINQTNATVTKNTVQNFKQTNLAVGNYSWSINCTDNFNNIGNSETRILAIIPSSDFTGITTNLSNINISNITNLIIDNPDSGQINFTQSVDLSSGADINTHVTISQNRIEVNSTALSALNTTARLKLYNLIFSNPQILKDGELCASDICTQESYTNNILTFNVTSFSVYSARENPSTSTTPSSSSGGGGAGSYKNPLECKKDYDCKEDYSCYENKCVKLFDVEIILISPLIDHLDFELEYLIKGMADINSDVIIEFWIEDAGKKIMLGKDTIYLGSFEEKKKTTQLNLPYELEDGDYDLYVQSGYEDYKAQSFRKVNIRVPEETRIKEKIERESEFPTLKSDDNFYLWIAVLSLVIFVLLLINKRTRILVLKALTYLKYKIHYPSIEVAFEDMDDDGRVTSEIKREIDLEKIEGRELKRMHQATQPSLYQKQVQTPLEEQEIKEKPALPSKTLNITSLSRKRVYSTHGNFIGTIEKAVLSKRRVHAWIIKPNKKYNLSKNILINHKYVKEINHIFIIDQHIEDHLEKIKGMHVPSKVKTIFNNFKRRQQESNLRTPKGPD